MLDRIGVPQIIFWHVTNLNYSPKYYLLFHVSPQSANQKSTDDTLTEQLATGYANKKSVEVLIEIPTETIAENPIAPSADRLLTSFQFFLKLLV